MDSNEGQFILYNIYRQIQTVGETSQCVSIISTKQF